MTHLYVSLAKKFLEFFVQEFNCKIDLNKIAQHWCNPDFTNQIIVCFRASLKWVSEIIRQKIILIRCGMTILIQLLFHQMTMITIQMMKFLTVIRFFFRYRNYYVIVKYVFSEFHQILKMKKIQKILKMKTIFWNLIKGKNLSSVRRVRIT